MVKSKENAVFLTKNEFFFNLVYIEGYTLNTVNFKNFHPVEKVAFVLIDVNFSPSSTIFKCGNSK